MMSLTHHQCFNLAYLITVCIKKRPPALQIKREGSGFDLNMTILPTVGYDYERRLSCLAKHVNKL